MIARCLAAAAALLVGFAAQAQTYPTRAVKMVIAFPPGGAIDVVARTLAQKLGFYLGQNVLVENRPGGNTLIGGEAVARSPADGYTVFMTLDTTMTHLPALVDKMPFDPVRDFAPISQVAVGASGFIGRAANPFHTFNEMIAWARSNPGKLNIGGAGPSTQTAIIELGRAANINIVMVPYKGTGPMLQALASGEIQVVSDGLAAYMPPIKQGVMVALATTSPRRYLALPSLPTVREAGLPQVEYDPWFGLFEIGRAHV